MKTLKEISQNITPLSEGVFDMEGDDRLAKGVETDLINMFLKSCKGNFNTVLFKDGSVRINGKLIISNIEGEKIPLKIRDFHGHLIIENCNNLVTLEGDFLNKIYVLDGSLTINQCPSLVSLKDIPGMVKGDVSITNCKKLKDLGTLESVFGNFYWEHNGKKYTKEQLAEKVHVIKKIICCSEDNTSADVNENLINEAVNNPWLQRLAKQFKQYPYKERSWDENSPLKYNTVDSFFRNYARTSYYGRVLDKISSEDIDVYDMGNEDDRKALSKAFYNAYSSKDINGGDIVLVYNDDIEEFVCGFGRIIKQRGVQGEGVESIIFPNKSNKYISDIRKDFLSKTEAKNKLLRFGTGYTTIVINTGDSTGTGDIARRHIKNDRAENRQGMITPGDIEQYKRIARDNVKRYKEIIAQNKINSKKNSDEFDKLNDAFEQIMTRSFKLIRDVSKNPKSYSKSNGFETKKDVIIILHIMVKTVQCIMEITD